MPIRVQFSTQWIFNCKRYRYLIRTKKQKNKNSKRNEMKWNEMWFKLTISKTNSTLMWVCVVQIKIAYICMCVYVYFSIVYLLYINDWLKHQVSVVFNIFLFRAFYDCHCRVGCCVLFWLKFYFVLFFRFFLSLCQFDSTLLFGRFIKSLRINTTYMCAVHMYIYLWMCVCVYVQTA